MDKELDDPSCPRKNIKVTRNRSFKRLNFYPYF